MVKCPDNRRKEKIYEPLKQSDSSEPENLPMDRT